MQKKTLKLIILLSLSFLSFIFFYYTLFAPYNHLKPASFHPDPLLADKEKQKTIRRNIPPGEDTKGLKNAMLALKDSPDITVGEFIGLVAPFTGDNGEIAYNLVSKMSGCNKLHI